MGVSHGESKSGQRILKTWRPSLFDEILVPKILLKASKPYHILPRPKFLNTWTTFTILCLKRLKKNCLNQWSEYRPMDGMNSWLIWQRVILYKLHTVTTHHVKIRSKNYPPRDSMLKQERHLWEPKRSACHLIQSNHFAKKLRASVSAQGATSSLLVSHSLEDRIKDRMKDRFNEKSMVLGNI